MDKISNHRRRLEQMRKELNVFNVHFMDIRRQDGTVFTYTSVNIPVHMTRRTIDNPDPQAVSTRPVISAYQINMDVDADVRNGDTLTVKVVNPQMEIIEAYRGVAGDPWTSNVRKRVVMAMNTLGRDDIRDDVIPPPLPEPPEADFSNIIIRFISNGEDIQIPLTYRAEKGKLTQIEALAIRGFKYSHAEMDGLIYDTEMIEFMPMAESYEITFFYETLDAPIYVKQFATGRFRMDNGIFATGNHWYMSIPLTWIDEFSAIIPTDRLTHIESRQILIIQRGTRLLFIPQEIIGEVLSIVRIQNGFKIEVTEQEMTQAERKAYITNSYGVYGE